MRIYGQNVVSPAPVPLLIYQTLAASDWLNFITDPTSTSIVKAGSTVNITRLSVGPTGNTGSSASDTLAWTVYSPSWTASTTNPLIGNGTITGRYKAIGKTVFVSVKIDMGSTTTYGSGAWRISLPVNAYASYSTSLPTLFYDTASGGVYYQGTSTTDYSANTSYVNPIWDKGTTYGVAIDSVTPFTWGTSTKLIINGSYESV